MRDEDCVRLCGLGDLDAASHDEVVADLHRGNGRPRPGPDEEVDADAHHADAVARRTVIAVIQLEISDVIDVAAAFHERQNVRTVYAGAEQDVFALLIRPGREESPQISVQDA